MAELSRRSNVPRETIHYYLREGLLPRPRKGGRTVAYYGEEHLERLKLIRVLREEKYLPVAVIRQLFDGEQTAAERDVATLADVLSINPTLGRAVPSRGVRPEALQEALQRGLLGRVSSAIAVTDARDATGPEARLLELVDETLELEPAARELTLRDLELCAQSVGALVRSESSLFFETVLQSSDIDGAVDALRAGRRTVARFIGIYRDLMLGRIVDELLEAVRRGPAVAGRTTVELSKQRAEQLGVGGELEALRLALNGARSSGRPKSTVAQAEASLALALLALGPRRELTTLGAALESPVAAVLAAWAAYDQTHGATELARLIDAVDAHPDFALGQVLLGEILLARAVRRSEGGSILEQAVVALHRLVTAEPENDPRPLGRALGLFHRGRVDLVLPSALGRADAGVAGLLAALEVTAAEPTLSPGAAAWIRANAHIALARHYRERGDEVRARRHAVSAEACDPVGPVTEIAAGIIADG